MDRHRLCCLSVIKVYNLTLQISVKSSKMNLLKLILPRSEPFFIRYDLKLYDVLTLLKESSQRNFLNRSEHDSLNDEQLEIMS